MLSLAIAVIVLGTYAAPSAEELERERAGLARNYPKTVKGVWDPGLRHGRQLIRDELPELKELGVNTIHVLLSHDFVDDELELRSAPLVSGEKAEREYIDRIVKAKKAGFAVSLVPTYFRHVPETIPDLEAFDEFVLEQARKWAQIAEAYKVEYFSPIDEYEKLMAAQGLSRDALVERVNSWNQKVLAEIRPVFKGKLVLKASPFLGDFSAQSATGFDILAIAFTLPSGEMPREELQRIVQGTFSEAQTVTSRDDVDWMVGEFFLFKEGRSEEERAELFEIVFVEYKETLQAENKPVGFTFFGWLNPQGMGKDSAIAPLLKRFFCDIEAAEFGGTE